MSRKTSLTRRQFLSRASLVAGAAPTFFTLRAAATDPHTGQLRASITTVSPAPASPVVSFHVDQPYLDKSGTALPYVPPAGARSGQPVSELSDLEFLSRHMYS